ncbi:MAG: hypothetical protein M1838_001126 [Thelocarpon superellum]|nr:MAG: hypothetical protein M1838_001126 [Thelocarpon superellum]
MYSNALLLALFSAANLVAGQAGAPFPTDSGALSSFFSELSNPSAALSLASQLGAGIFTGIDPAYLSMVPASIQTELSADLVSLSSAISGLSTDFPTSAPAAATSELPSPNPATTPTSGAASTSAAATSTVPSVTTSTTATSTGTVSAASTTTTHNAAGTLAPGSLAVAGALGLALMI